MRRAMALLVAALCGLLTPACASAQIEWSGFFDIQYAHTASDTVSDDFTYGQFEVDLSMPLTNRISAEAAMAWGDGSFELGSGFIDIHLQTAEEEHPPRGTYLSHSGFIVGQFDVPFGIDYRVIPSPDRKLVSPPLVNQRTIDSWDDMGVQIYGVGPLGNFVLFGVNGFSEGQAYGGRIGITPVKGVEAGVSYALDRTMEGHTEVTVLGVDGAISMAPVEVKGEFTAMEEEKTVAPKKHAGFYVQASYDLHPIFAVGRYGRWTPKFDEDGDGQNDPALTRITLGAGYRIVEQVEVRVEHQINKEERDEEKNDQTTVQWVVSF